MWKAEVNLGCHSLWFSSLAGLGLTDSVRLLGQQIPDTCLSLLFPELVSQAYVTMPPCYMGSGDQSQVLMHAEQALYWWSHLSSPANSILKTCAAQSLSLRSYSSKQAGEENFPGPPCSSLTGQCSGGAPRSSLMLPEGSPIRWCRLATSVFITPGDGSAEASTVQSCRWQLHTYFLHYPSCPVLCPLSAEGLCLTWPHKGLCPSAHKVRMEQFLLLLASLIL